MVSDKTTKRNTPIATLIKNYVNKKSGKVTDSRNEIRRRFDYLDWKDQNKIVLAFLESGMADRQWAYSKLLNFWEKSFEPRIKELWELFHEEKCSWVIIRHFPVEYIARNIDKFTGERDYYFICLRLAQEKDFVIEREKLSLTDYLAVLFHTGRNIKEDEANDILFQIVHENTVRRPSIELSLLDRYANRNKGAVITPIDFHDVSLAIYYLRKLNCGHVTSLFEEWNDSIRSDISNSPEFKAINRLDLDDYEYLEAAICVAKKYAYLALDDKYKNLSDPDVETIFQSKKFFDELILEEDDADVLKRMMEMNPSLEKLVGDFDLHVVESEIPF